MRNRIRVSVQARRLSNGKIQVKRTIRDSRGTRTKTKTL